MQDDYTIRHNQINDIEQNQQMQNYEKLGKK